MNIKNSRLPSSTNGRPSLKGDHAQVLNESRDTSESRDPSENKERPSLKGDHAQVLNESRDLSENKEKLRGLDKISVHNLSAKTALYADTSQATQISLETHQTTSTSIVKKDVYKQTEYPNESRDISESRDPSENNESRDISERRDTSENKESCDISESRDPPENQHGLDINDSRDNAKNTESTNESHVIIYDIREDPHDCDISESRGVSVTPKENPQFCDLSESLRGGSVMKSTKRRKDCPALKHTPDLQSILIMLAMFLSIRAPRKPNPQKHRVPSCLPGDLEPRARIISKARHYHLRRRCYSRIKIKIWLRILEVIRFIRSPYQPKALAWPPPATRRTQQQRRLSAEEQFLGSSRRNCVDGDGPRPTKRHAVGSSPSQNQKHQSNSTSSHGNATDELFEDTISRMTIQPENFGIVTLNMDGALPGKSDHLARTFRQLRLLGVQGILMQDHRCTETEFQQVLHSAATHLFATKELPTSALSPAPISPNGQAYGGVAILLPPHMRRRVTKVIKDERDLGRYVLITLGGRSGSSLTLCSLYVTPAPGSPNGVHATQARALAKDGSDQDPTSALYKDLTRHLTEQRSHGNELLLGADFQTNMHIPELPASQRAWSFFQSAGLMNTTSHFDPLAVKKPTYYKGAAATTIDAILTTSATLQIHTRKCDVFERHERLNNSDHRAVLIEIDLDRLLSIDIQKSRRKDIPKLRFQKIKAAKELLKTGPELSPLAREFKNDLNDAYKEHLQNNPDKLEISDLDSLTQGRHGYLRRVGGVRRYPSPTPT
jgi:hypothetical protein